MAQSARDDALGRSDAVTELAPAKVNLFLHVVGRRADGFHELISAVAFTEFGDAVTVRAAAADAFEIVGNPEIDAGPGNLVVRARDRLRAVLSDAPPVHITLEKRIPVAAGLGGGSTDAAATLRALCRVWNVAPSMIDLNGIAADLGADVPMCLHSRAVLARGIGEQLEALPEAVSDQLEGFDVVLANPGIPVSTPAVFKAFRNPNGAPPPPFTGAPLDWLHRTRNDLEASAIEIAPQIADTLEAMNDARLTRMSGSGATCFALYDRGMGADAAARLRERLGPNAFVVPTRFASLPEGTS